MKDWDSTRSVEAVGGGLESGLVLDGGGRINNPPQDAILHHKCCFTALGGTWGHADFAEGTHTVCAVERFIKRPLGDARGSDSECEVGRGARVILKVCGITNEEDAAAAIAAGATAIGFNFYSASPRYISPKHAASIATVGARRVGVFVNESPVWLEQIARTAALDIAQLHGDETPAEYPTAIRVWKAVRVVAGFDLSQLADSPAEALLLDGPAAELYGGAGHTFNWQLAAGARHRIIIAGGLDADNVARAIALARPWGVDSCSKIERSPGIKDHTKMTEFLQAAKAALGA